MSDSMLFIAGSIHQGHQSFSHISRGRQCSFISFSALLFARNLAIEQWSAATVDQILVEGDRLYRNALRSGSIPDAEVLSLNYLPNVACWSSETNSNYLPSTAHQDDSLICMAESQTCSQYSLIWADNDIESLNWVTNTDLPMVEKRHCQFWFVKYKEFYQGRIMHYEHEKEAPYFGLNSALLNAFSNSNDALVILDGYVMALIKTTDCIFVFDSHARNCYGMPDPNGTAVVMKCADICSLEEYLCSISLKLNTELFEVVPVEFHRHNIDSDMIDVNKVDNTQKNKSTESEIQRLSRLQKAREYKQRRLSEETDIEKTIRLQRCRASRKRKISQESETERHIRLDKRNASKKQRLSEETDSQRQIRLAKDNACHKRKRSQKIKIDKTTSQGQSTYEDNVLEIPTTVSKEDYLNKFNVTQYGELHEQKWARSNISKFHNAIHFSLFQCIICQEAWPLKSKPRSPDSYVCSRCSRDKKSPNKFSKENSMIPCPVPPQLQGLTQTEEMLIARALPLMRVYIKPGGQRGYSGHCINLPQNINDLASSLPRYPKDLSVIIVNVKGKDNTFKDVNVRRQKVLDALLWLRVNNPLYKDVEINVQALEYLPINGIPSDLLTVETSDYISDEVVEPDVGPPTDNPSEDVVYDESTETSSLLPVGEQHKQELDAIKDQLSGKQPVPWPTLQDEPLNEYQTPYLATMAFPALFPDGKGDPTNQALRRDVPFAERIKHLIKFAENIDGKWVYRFASHPRFSYWALNMIQRQRTLQQTGIFLKQNPGEAHLNIDELREMAESNNSTTFMSKVSRYVANIAGTNAYWHRVKEDLKAIITNVGTPTFFFTFSSADMHWPELHALFGDDNNTTSEIRRQNVINNPHIVDWYFSQRLESFIKHWLYDTLDAKWHWFRFEYQGRGSIHCHGTAKLNNDPGLCQLTELALKGYLAEKYKHEHDVVDTTKLDQDIEAGNKAAQTACQYVDWLLSTVNPNPPDDDMWIRPQVHPCQRSYKDIPEHEKDSDYIDLLNTVQRHTRCSTNYCLRKKQNEGDLKCRFHFPFDHSPQTRLEFEKVHTKSNELQHRAKIVTKRNDSRLNNNQRLQLQGWRANCDLQVVIDHYACVEYLTKYVAKGEPRSSLLKQTFNSIIQNMDATSDPHKAIKKVVMKTLGERDYAAQETMHHLLSLKLHSSSFNVIPVSLDGSRRICINVSEDNSDSCSNNSLLDVYAHREQYDRSADIVNLNFVQFATKFKLVNGKLTQLPANVIPRIFPTYSSNPKGPNFALYCKYQLLRYKPWKLTINNAWGDQEPSDEIFIAHWHAFLQTQNAQTNVPDWFDKLQHVIQSQQNSHNEHTSQPDNNSREEWMIISDLHTPFEFSDGTAPSHHDWHLDRISYTDQQIGEMSAWIKTKKEQAANSISPAHYDFVDIRSFSEMQKVAYNIVKSHSDNMFVDKDPLCLIVIGVAGTGKSYLIHALHSLLQQKCAITATTGKASYNIKGVTVHSLLKLPVGTRGNKDLAGESLCRLQQSLNGIRYIIIDEYSMLGQTTLGWIDKRCKQVTGNCEKILGGMSLILIGDPGQLPPVGDKPLFHAKPSSAIGEQGYQTYRMFDKVVKLTVNQRVQGISSTQEQFRHLLLRLRKGESTSEDWQLLLTRQPLHITDLSQFDDATRLYYTNDEVAKYNHDQLIKLQQPVAHVNACHSSAVAKIMPSEEMSGLEPTIFLAKGAKVMLTMNLWPAVGLCNGATGTVIDIIYENNHQPPDMPIAVIVKFDDYLGPSINDTLPSCVPICPITVSANLHNSIHERQQLPLRLAYALTIHKSQGLTLTKAWIDIGKSEKTPGISYVGISRVKTLSSSVIEPMTFERLTSLKSSAVLQYRLDEETRLDNLAKATYTAFKKLA